MCTVSGGSPDSGSVFFPSPGQAAVLETPASPASVTPLMRKAGVCSSSTSGRQVLVRQGGGGATPRSDVSSCNVLEGGADVVYMPWDETVYVAQNDLGGPALVAVGVLTVYLAIALAHNLEFILRGVESSTPLGAVELALLSLVALVLLGDGRADPLAPYITLEDHVCFAVLVAYVLYYACRGVAGSLAAYSVDLRANPSPVNPVVASLVLVSMRVHHSIDNSYTAAGAWMVGARLLNKLTTLAPGGLTPLLLLDLALDSLLLSLLAYTGVAPYCSMDPTYTALASVQGAALALAADLLMQSFELGDQQAKRQ